MTSTDAAKATPADDELKEALTSLRSSNASLGIPKLHALLLSTYPSWTVSEKRTRKILQSAGLVNAPPPPKEGNGHGENIYPASKLVKGLDVTKWTSKVEVKQFGKKKGKGLVAKEKIAEGEVLWKEDPFILAPEWDVYALQERSGACAFCSTPLTTSNITVTCPASTSTAHCPARFCSRLCLTRSSKHTHPLLCPAQNPASVPLMQFTRKNGWMGLHALAQCAARMLMAAQQTDGEKQVEQDWYVVSALAELSLEDRAKSPWYNKEPDRPTWEKAHKLYVQAFQTPATPADQKKLAKILRKPLPEHTSKELFEYEGFLRGLGKMNLNLEAHGGLYTLHSHLNHSCSPSLSVRHLDPRSALARITVIARREIEPGEELTVTYVNPELSVFRRRAELGGWGFGECDCERCVKESKEEAERKEKEKAEGKGGDEDEAANGKEEKANLGDLEKELKAGLGVI